MGRGGTRPYQEDRYETGGETAYTVGWRLRSLGYGAAQIAVPPGELKVTGRRFESTRGSALPVPHLVEWFHNTPAGLEHGFTLPERPRMGSTGDPPVPSGDSPNGMGEDASTDKDSSLPDAAPLVPVGGSPTGVDESPTPPNFQTRAEPLC